MALKKSQIYSTLWKSCDELRGGMDASQYKDYVLTLLFMKYVSDKEETLIEVPEGGSFADMVALKGDKEIGDKINTIIGRLAEANDLKGVITQADFNDETKLGSGKAMQDRLSKLVAIFDELDFSSNRAGGDDLLGDAYEYLMRHFATESGKSKGQFYTPAEVSRIMAKVIGIEKASTLQSPTVYDPTCGSGSLLIKAASETDSTNLSIWGQEMDNATWALAKMNMFLHEQETAQIWRGNTLAAPHFKDADGTLKTFDFAVANPPFSYKSWSNGLDPANDTFGRFEYGVPPAKNGDYAFLLHFITSLKSKGKGAIILPHGVLFRGNREADIRRNLVKRGLVKGIIGLPANLFYGTGIPACILVLDKENAHAREGLFMIDASKGFVKDGAKNRLREQDIHKIVDVFTKQRELPRYARMVPIEEIASDANDYNLNLPRYIDSSDPEDLHDLHAHLNGGIPRRDIDDLNDYWNVFPSLREDLFESNGHPDYREPKLETGEVKDTILEHDDFTAYAARVSRIVDAWRDEHEPMLMDLSRETKPKDVIHTLAEDLLRRFADVPLVSRYDVYQRLMDYWREVMQDDVYLIAAEGWEAGRILGEAYDKETPDFKLKRGRKTKKYVGEIIPATLVIARYFDADQAEVDELEAAIAEAAQRKEDLEEEHAGEGGALSGLEGARGDITKGNVRERVMELKETILQTAPNGSPEYRQAKTIKKTTFEKNPWQTGVADDEGLFEELDILHAYLQADAAETTAKTRHKERRKALYTAVSEMYPELSEADIKTLVVDDTWFAAIRVAIEGEVQRVTGQLATRIKELEERYADPLPALEEEVATYSARVEEHLKTMGVA